MPIPQLLLTRFFQLTFNRDFAEAERVLAKIREKTSKAAWGRGYIAALDGVMSAYKGKNDRYAYINRIDLNKENLARIEAELQDKARDLIYSEFDRGFFSAWSDLIRFLDKSELQNIGRQRSTQEEPIQETEPSTSGEP